MEQANIYLVRHGQTQWNAERRIQGLTDIPLDDHGRQQAKKVGQDFSDLCIGAIYASYLRRAQETAEIIAEFHGCGIFIEPLLHEGKYGKLEGMTVADFHEKYAQAIQVRHILSLEERIHHKYEPDAESIHEIVTRVTSVLHRLAKEHIGENVIVVTHGFVMRSLLTVLGGFDEREIMVGNGGVLHLKGDGVTLRIVKHDGIEFKSYKEIESRKERIC